MSEFAIAVYYRYLHRDAAEVPSSVLSGSQCKQQDMHVTQTARSPQESNTETTSCAAVDVVDVNKGTAFTKLGPAAYAGDILDDPELLWTEDVWNEVREEEAQRKLAEQGSSISDYWKNQYETKAGTFWHKFYKRNADHFYKDRHYLHLVFPELLGGSAQTDTSESAPLHLLEVGCGVGNAVLPLIEINPNIHVVAMDFARSAIEILNKHPFVVSCFDEDIAGPPTFVHGITTHSTANSNAPASTGGDSSTESTAHEHVQRNECNQHTGSTSSNEQELSDALAKRRVRTAVRCIVKDPLPVGAASMDLSLCMFVLSAISPTEQLVALRKIADVLKPGGKLLVRDYGR